LPILNAALLIAVVEMEIAKCWNVLLVGIMSQKKKQNECLLAAVSWRL
jgi:hypothetical protein